MLRFDFDFDLSDAFQRIADAVEGFLAKDAEPQPAPIYCSEQMKTMLRHLSHALHFGDPAWPHTESQAQLAIRYLEVTAKSLVWGQTHDDSIVACFLDEGGLSILIRALLTYQLPRSIKLQVYQSTCMIAQNAKDIRLCCFWRVSGRYPLYSGLRRWTLLWFGFVACSASIALCKAATTLWSFCDGLEVGNGNASPHAAWGKVFDGHMSRHMQVWISKLCWLLVFMVGHP